MSGMSLLYESSGQNLRDVNHSGMCGMQKAGYVYGEVPFRQFQCRQLPFRQPPFRQFPFRRPDENGEIPFPFRQLPYALFSVAFSVSRSGSHSVSRTLLLSYFETSILFAKL